MQPIVFDAAVQFALDSILNDRLAVLTGAGLSMAPPSSLPSAASVAAMAKQKYDAIHGLDRDPLPTRIEDQAEFFFQRNELSTVYFRSLIDQHVFAGPPNQGHYAIADLLLIRGIQTAVTTNVDNMIETAGQMLLGQIGAGVGGHEVAQLGTDVSPLLKIHGCRTIEPEHMVWAPGQLAAPPVSDRIASSAQWLTPRLHDRDLVIIGYWTDWDYLNAILARTLGAVRPARVLVVDPCDSATFEGKAPDLYAVGQESPATFYHVRASGAEFLEAVRLRFSRAFVRQALHGGANDFTQIKGGAPRIEILEPPNIGNDELWSMRRDLEGCEPGRPCAIRVPPNESLIGLTILQLRERGASANGHLWVLEGQRVRVLRSPNQFLHQVIKTHERGTAPLVTPEVTIAVGAEESSLASDIVREGSPATIARGSTGRWMTRPMAVLELDL